MDEEKKQTRDYKEQISQLERQVRQRGDQLVSQDPLCNRLIGRIEVLRQVLVDLEQEGGK